MDVIVTSTSGGQSGTLRSPKAAVASHHLAPHETLPGMTARKFRECHTKRQVPSLLGSWGPGHRGNGRSGWAAAACGSNDHMVLSFPGHPHLFTSGSQESEHVTPSVTMAGQGKTDQVQMFPRERELASGVGCSRPREKGVKSQAGPQRQ